ncbi:MAG TPA: SMP-30/gluconolactonase/LRE family protein [Thermomicrobiales bacterium]|nr:SMP-30/gluconolactonase/LRE family protein [Thermomicrobiales bacterium]
MADSNAIWDVTAGLAGKPLLSVSAFRTLADGLDHPEGVACGPHGEIYAGGEAGQLYQVAEDGAVTEIARTGGFLLGLCLDAAGAVYACDNGLKHEVVRIAPDGTISAWSNGAPERRMQTPNYPVFAADGALYVSDSGAWNGNDGCLFRVSPTGGTTLFSDTLTAFPNGLAIDPSGSWLYVVLSQMPGVVRLPLDLGSGRKPAPETVVELPHNVPDGLAFDEENNLYIACYAPSVIYRLERGLPGGRLETLVADWESTQIAAPTNIAFCGPERRTFVVASLARWHLSAVEMPVPGAPLVYPALP